MPYKDPEKERERNRRRIESGKAREARERFNKIHPGRKTELVNRWRKEHPKEWRNIVLKHNFGITLDDVEKKKVDQDFRCAICKERLPLAVDHDHATGEFRGLLCYDCNCGIGMFKDRPSIILKAAEYLAKNK